MLRFFHMHVILVHGWKGSPENAWFPWLRRELESRGYTTEALVMPHPAFPDRQVWVDHIKASITSPDTVLIGHSLGCPSILLALQSYDGPPLARVVLVAGFARLFQIPLLEHWFGEARIDLNVVRSRAASWRVLHGRFDPLVPFREGEWMAEGLGVPLIETHSHRGHLTPVELAFEVPEILQAVIK